MATTWIVLIAFVLAFALLSRKLDGFGVSAPMVFVAFGALVGPHALGLPMAEGATDEATSALAHGVVDVLAELTLMLVLFGDASRIDLQALRRESGLPGRMLAIGMPLTIALGAVAAKLLFPSLSVWEAALLAAVLAPTDAALGQAVVSSEQVPPAIRQSLNVESGLNDGVALPVVMVFAALASGGEGEAAQATGEGTKWVVFWLMQVGLGPVAGILVALVGGYLAERACASGAMGETFERIAGLSLAPLAYFAAEAIGGNGFIAAFVAGLVLGNTARGFAGSVHAFLETEGQLLMIAVFALVGALWAVDVVAGASAMAWVYAGLSLTAIRMVPVALSMVGKGVRWPTVAFLGWFGPRGLATVLFGLIIIEREAIAHREQLFAVAMLTVLLSVFAHGLSARPGARRYGQWAKAAGLRADASEMAEVMEHPTRHDPERPSKLARALGVGGAREG